MITQITLLIMLMLGSTAVCITSLLLTKGWGYLYPGKTRVQRIEGIYIQVTPAYKGLGVFISR